MEDFEYEDRSKLAIIMTEGLFAMYVDLESPTVDNTVDWDATFAPSLGTEASRKLIERLGRARGAIVADLQSPHFDSKTLIAHCNDYLPAVNLLLESLNNQSKVNITQTIVFSWTPSFGGKRRAFTAIIYEIIMVLHTLSWTHYRSGCKMTKLGSPEDLAAAAKHFLSAASVISHLGERVLPRWIRKGEDSGEEMPELHEGSCTAFAHLCVAAAQQCVVLQAVHKKSPPAVVSKLCSAVTKCCEDSIHNFTTIPLHAYNNISSAVLEHLSLLKEGYGALSYMYQGKSKATGGQAIGNYKAAIALLVQQGAKGAKDHKHDPRKSGLPNLRKQGNATSTAIGILLSTVRNLLEEAERDNSLIYFETEAEVILPSPVLLAQTSSAPYEPTALGPLVVFKKVEENRGDDSAAPILPPPGADPAALPSPSPSMFDGFFGRSKSNGDGGPTGSSSASMKSDEELAWELQRKFDEEVN